MSDSVRITCVAESCGTFPMDRALVQKLKRTGDTFTCPAGHEQHFTESPEQRYKERIKRLKEKISHYERRVDSLDDSLKDRWGDYKREKSRREYAESRLLDYVNGVVEVAEERYRWSCECDARGEKAFDDPDKCRYALKRHRNRYCPIDESVEVPTQIE